RRAPRCPGDRCFPGADRPTPASTPTLPAQLSPPAMPLSCYRRRISNPSSMVPPLECVERRSKLVDRGRMALGDDTDPVSRHTDRARPKLRHSTPISEIGLAADIEPPGAQRRPATRESAGDLVERRNRHPISAKPAHRGDTTRLSALSQFER